MVQVTRFTKSISMSAWWPSIVGGITLFSSYASSDEGETPRYPSWNYWIKMGCEVTQRIDALLVDSTYGEVAHKVYNDGGGFKPNKGTHYYYLETKPNRSFFPYKYINLIKKVETVTTTSNSQNQDSRNQEKYYYVACFSKSNKDVFDKFLERLYASNEHEVKAIHIDTSGYDIKSVLVTRFAETCKPIQQQAIDWIQEHFLLPENRKNTKVVISGPSGVGKTYATGLLKKAIEASFPGYARNSFVQLFIDFNPCSPGLNVQSQVLTKAKLHMPVILVINEVDVCYKEVFKNKNDRDPRTAHTRDKGNFTSMLDSIANAPDVITIFTTEKSKAELDAVNSIPENPNEIISYKPFYRKGRVDFFIELTKASGNTPGTATKIDTTSEE